MKPAAGCKVLRMIIRACSISLWLSVSSGHADHKLCEDMELTPAQDPKFELGFDSTDNLITLTGPFEIGVVAAFADALKKYSHTAGVVLDSPGGNVYQARGLAKLIEKYRLDTYAFGICYSSCTLAFIAGKKKYLGKHARLGFHAYQIDPGQKYPSLDIDKEQQKDLQFYSRYIADTDFVEKIFSTNCSGIWEPHLDELLNAKVVDEVIP